MTHDDDPIDFSPLDPARDAPRWDRAIDRVVARAVAARRPSVLREVSRTGVFVFALAAAAAAAMWFGRRPGASQPTTTHDPVTEWSRWASGEDVDPLSLIDSGGAR
jgi:hypothetical protein